MISKEKLIKDIRVYADLKGANGEVELANGILKALSIIKEQPIAYDADKVVKQLEKNKINCNNSGTIFDTWDYVKLNKAIEIVKSGSNDE